MKKLFSLGPLTVHKGDISVLVLGLVIGAVSSYFASWLWARNHNGA